MAEKGTRGAGKWAHPPLKKLTKRKTRPISTNLRTEYAKLKCRCTEEEHTHRRISLNAVETKKEETMDSNPPSKRRNDGKGRLVPPMRNQGTLRAKLPQNASYGTSNLHIDGEHS
ncbi:hypothetical protein Hypma_016206 [Hypsizygus marmoreus]|uniref:Uncharacterized protein n=1 Tax=Hypsizygus marmoreus TaxID=39966 RepID=A0A369IXU7_HYPMA|nr:hypothetical protein Hypma_016206 [Hypsizygus marmoreus]